MKNEKDIETPGAGNYAWAAIKDARSRNITGRAYFTNAQVTKALGVQSVLENCYGVPSRNSMMNFRVGKINATNSNKFIAIKIFTNTISDRKNLRKQEKNMDADPIYSRLPEKVRTKGGDIIYRLYF